MPHGSGTEKVVLGSSRGAIEVEAVNLDKIRGNLSNIEKLREVSLDDERIAVPGQPGEIRKMCPGMLCLLFCLTVNVALALSTTSQTAHSDCVDPVRL